VLTRHKQSCQALTALEEANIESVQEQPMPTDMYYKDAL